MVTAEIELVTGIALIVYLATNHLAQWYDYTFGPFLFIACFAIMQRSLMAMIGFRYKDMFAIAKKTFREIKLNSLKDTILDIRVEDSLYIGIFFF